MKVNGYGIIKPGSNVRKREGASSAGVFSDFLNAAQSEGASGVTEAGEVATTASLSGLLALQEISEEDRRKQRLVKQGKTMLDALESLRQRLLIGDIPNHMLSELETSLAVQKESIGDPRLLMIIEEIELRVAVELAKLEMSVAARAEI